MHQRKGPGKNSSCFGENYRQETSGLQEELNHKLSFLFSFIYIRYSLVTGNIANRSFYANINQEVNILIGKYIEVQFNISTFLSQGTPPIDRFYSNIKEVNVLNQNYIKVYDPILYKHHNKWKLFFDETLAYIFIIQHIYACTNIALGGGFKPLISR